MKKIKRPYIILHSIALIWLIIVVFFINQILGGIENPVSAGAKWLFRICWLSTLSSIFFFFPLDTLLISRKIKTFPKVQASWAYSIMAYLITFGIAELHMWIISPGKHDSYDYVLEHVFSGFNSVFSVMWVYLLFFLLILLGLDIFLRYLANRYIYDKNVQK